MVSCCWGSSTLYQEHFDLKSQPHILSTFSCLYFFLSPTLCLSLHVILTTLWQLSVETVCCPVKRDRVIFHAVDIRFEISSSHPGTLSPLNQACVKGAGGQVVGRREPVSHLCVLTSHSEKPPAVIQHLWEREKLRCALNVGGLQ